MNSKKKKKKAKSEDKLKNLVDFNRTNAHREEENQENHIKM